MTERDTTLQVTILGSGTCVPSLQRSSCSVLLQTDLANVVLDCGAGTMRRLLEAGLTVCDVTYLFFSHFHPDHTGEMASFLFANGYAFSPARSQPLLLAGGEGFVPFFQSFRDAYGRWIELDANLLQIRSFSATKQETNEFEDFKLTTMPATTHRPESIAFRAESKGRSIVYTGDTDYDENLIWLSRGADLLICESAMPDNLKKPGHLTPSLAGKIAQSAAVKTLVLTHLYPECEKVDIEQQAAATFDGPVIAAEDLMQFALED